MQKPKSFLFRYKFPLPPSPQKVYKRREESTRVKLLWFQRFKTPSITPSTCFLPLLKILKILSTIENKIYEWNNSSPLFLFCFSTLMFVPFIREENTALRNVIYRNLFALNNLRLASFLSTYTYTEKLLHNPFAFRSFR